LNLKDLLSVWKTCNKCRKECFDSLIWKRLLEKDLLPYHTSLVSSFLDKPGANYRDLYISIMRSKVSVVGLKHKPTTQFSQFKAGKNPFWILHLFTKRKENTLDYQWLYKPDESSQYGVVARMWESQRIQIEGSTYVYASGTFQVLWRLKKEPHTVLGTVTFIVSVENEKQIVYQWSEEEQSTYPPNEWFLVPIGQVDIKCERSYKPAKVSFSMHQFDLDFKYELCVDYVALNPILPIE